METNLQSDNRHEIISLVKQNRILWDKNCSEFNNRAKKNSEWFRIANAVGMSNEKTRRIWENLRDQYRRDLKRSMKGSGKGKWKFNKEMDFLRPMMKLQSKNSELSSGETDNDESLDSLLKSSNSNQEKYRFLQPAMLVFPQPDQLLQMQKFNTNTSNPSIAKECMTTLTTNCSSVLTPQLQLAIKPNEHNPTVFIHPVSQSDSAFQKADNTMKIEVSSDPEDEACIKLESSNEIDPEIETDKSLNEIDEISFKPSNDRIPEIIRHDTLTSQSGINAISPQNSSYHSTLNESSIVASNHSSVDLTQNAQLNMDQVQDEDYHFVMSILPYLRKVTSNRKLLVRMAIMNTLSNEFILN